MVREVVAVIRFVFCLFHRSRGQLSLLVIVSDRERLSKTDCLARNMTDSGILPLNSSIMSLKEESENSTYGILPNVI